MTTRLDALIALAADRAGDRTALLQDSATLSYAELDRLVSRVATGLLALGLEKQERVAVYLPKRLETVAAIFGTALAGGVFVPVNPLLKPPQVGHILRDCAVRVLVTTAQRLRELADELARCPDLRTLVVVATARPHRRAGSGRPSWARADRERRPATPHRVIDTDMAAILYTSGSTGKPKGVVLSHRNMVTGAKSVAQYLENTRRRPAARRAAAQLRLRLQPAHDRVPRGRERRADGLPVPARRAERSSSSERITGLAAVPPVWIQLAELEWPATRHRAPALLHELRRRHADARRSTKLRAALAEDQALPDVRPDRGVPRHLPAARGGRPPAGVDGQGHPEYGGHGGATGRHPLRPRRTRRTRPARLPGGAGLLERSGQDRRALQARARASPRSLPITEMAVWSGDTVRMDEDGFLYFIGRKDEMIKTSGYRVSPTEVEEVAYASGLVGDAVAVGAPHPDLGQAIVLVVSAPVRRRQRRDEGRATGLLAYLKSSLPNFMVPHHIAWLPELPRNPNGKFDRPPSRRSSRPPSMPRVTMLDAFSQHAPHPYFDAQDGELLIGGRKVSTIAAELGRTPFYAYDRAVMTRKVQELRAALPAEVEIHYAMKANPMPAVVRHFCGLVDGIDVASAGEMDVALAAGMRPELDQLRRARQDAGRTRARRRRRHRDQHGIRARDAAPRRHRAPHRRAAEGRGARQPGLRAEDLRHEDGRRPEAVRRRRRARAAAARGTRRRCRSSSGASTSTAARRTCGPRSWSESQQKTAALAHRAGAARARRRCACSTSAAASASRTSRASSRSTSRRSARTSRTLVPQHPARRCRRRPLRSNSAATWSANPACTSAGCIDKKVSRGHVFLITDGGLHHHLAASGNFGQVIRKNYPVLVAQPHRRAARARECLGRRAAVHAARPAGRSHGTRGGRGRRSDRGVPVGRVRAHGEPARVPEPSGGDGASGLIGRVAAHALHST